MIIKDLPKFENKQDKIDYIAKHFEDIVYEAKSTIKEADAIPMAQTIIKSLEADKGQPLERTKEEGVIKARLIINTTNYMDSHLDVHIPGLWNKSLKENQRIKHKQEHGNTFAHIIADKEDLKAFTKTYEWKELGYDVEGKTQALVFDSTIRKSRNEYMYNQYKEGHVDNHSVGMQYVKILYAANSDKEEHAQYKANWDKYYPEIINKADADREGLFFPVLEAKAREGSAVPDGSNPITPTQSRKAHSEEGKEVAEKNSLSPEIINFLNL